MKKIMIEDFEELLKNDKCIFDKYEINGLDNTIYVEDPINFYNCKLSNINFCFKRSVLFNECEIVNCSFNKDTELDFYKCLFKYTTFPHSLNMSFYGPKFLKPNFPAPSIMLLNYWNFHFSDELKQELMIYDCANHPNPELFDEWANSSNKCPYKLPNLETNFNVARNAKFNEDPSLWKPEFKNRQPKSALWLLTKILEEMNALIKE